MILMGEQPDTQRRRDITMPQVTDNPDGSKTFSINSNELRGIRDLIVAAVPDLKRMLSLTESAPVRATLNFVKSVIN